MCIKILILFLMISSPSLSQSGWVQLPGTGGNEYCDAMSFINQNTGYISISGLQIIKTTNGGTNWVTLNFGVQMQLYSLCFINEQTGWGSGSSGRIIRTTNGGLNWQLISEITPFYLWDICFVNSNTGWLVTGAVNYGIYRSTNGGINWHQQLSLQSDSRSVYFLNENTGWVTTGGSLLKTTNAGNNWSSSTPAINDSYWDVYFINDQTGWTISNNSKKIYRTVNGGNTWINQFTFQQSPYCINATILGNLYVGFNNYGIIQRSQDLGNSWFEQYSHALQGTFIKNIWFADNNIGYASGSNGRILKTTNGGVTIINLISSEIPKEFSLSQNYPNPFNPSTNIKFDVPESGIIKLTIFDVLGKEIQTLVQQHLSPGTYNADFNASALPSGVYYYKLETETFTQTKKMVLIK